MKIILIRYPVFGMVGFVRLFQQNTRLQLGPFVFADPGEFEFGFLFGTGH
ncbi:hypothetical protein [Porticoccus sp.]|nr:hypothetical protein [Porticoccus sp.]